MTNGINTREMILEILLQIEEEGEHSHIAIRNALSKYQFLPKQERAFVTRVCEGTLEYRITIDYIIDSFSKITVDKMKPPIREILRSAVYQLRYMDRVPDSAVCNEAVKLAQKKGFYNLKPFVNGVLRTAARQMNELEYPSREENLVRYLSVRYSMPEELVNRWLEDYGEEITEKMLADFLREKPVTIRCRTYLNSVDKICDSLKSQGVTVEPAPYLPYAKRISGYNHILALDAFIQGKILVQDVSSMLAGEAAAPGKGSYVIDLCAAPGGKTICVADKMQGTGLVDSRDVSEKKTDLIRENVFHQLGEYIDILVDEYRFASKENILTIPEGDYACFTTEVRGNFADFSILADWLEDHGYSSDFVIADEAGLQLFAYNQYFYPCEIKVLLST